jgi:hypothetical protein
MHSPHFRLTCPSTFLQPELKPLLEKDIPKVVQAIRQTQSKKVLFKLLTRIKVRLHIDHIGKSNTFSVDHRGPSGTAADHAVTRLQSDAQYSRRSRQRHRHHHYRELLFSSRDSHDVT